MQTGINPPLHGQSSAIKVDHGNDLGWVTRMNGPITPIRGVPARGCPGSTGAGSRPGPADQRERLPGQPLAHGLHRVAHGGPGARPAASPPRRGTAHIVPGARRATAHRPPRPEATSTASRPAGRHTADIQRIFSGNSAEAAEHHRARVARPGLGRGHPGATLPVRAGICPAGRPPCRGRAGVDTARPSGRRRRGPAATQGTRRRGRTTARPAITGTPGRRGPAAILPFMLAGTAPATRPPADNEKLLIIAGRVRHDRTS